MEGSLLKPNEICDEVISTGIKKSKYSNKQVILLGLMAGGFIAIGAFSAALASHGVADYGISKLIAGAIFPVGLMFVLICGADLFTGNCLMAVSLVEKKITFKSMLKNWSIVYLTNFIGTFIIAFLIFNSGLLSTNSDKLGAYAIKVAYNKSNLTFVKSLSSGILCNFVVCLAVWGAYAAKDMIGKIFIIWFPIMAFVVAGFEHSVANMYYFTIGMFAKTSPALVEASHFSAEQLSHLNLRNIIINNMIPVTIGNIIGGAVFVGLAYWAIYKQGANYSSVKKDIAA